MIRTTLRSGVLKRMLGAGVLALASASAAQAAVITFEGNSGPAYNQNTIQQAGYSITFYDPGAAAPPGTVQIGRFINGSNSASCGAGNICPTNNSTTYLDLFNSGFIDILPNASGATFTFTGLDASFIAMTGVDYALTPAAVQVIGFTADGGQTAIQFNIPRDTAFRTYTLADAVGDPDFGTTSFTEIAIVGYRCNAQGQCSGLDNGNGQVGLDNIRLSDVPINAVPEPATAALLAFGLLGLGARVRRRS
jgi:hypothetical protein